VEEDGEEEEEAKAGEEKEVERRRRARSKEATTRGRRKEKRLPSPTLLSMLKLQTRKRGFVLRYFSMMPLQFIRPKPKPFWPSAERSEGWLQEAFRPSAENP
jgi:hypothetical protein